CACSCSMRISAISCWCSLFAADAGAAAMTRPATTTARRMVGFISSLRGNDEVRAPVLGIRGLVMPGIERELLAVAHRAEPIGRDPQRYQIGACGNRPPFAQRQIVLGGPAFVAVPSDGDRPGRVFPQNGRVLLERLLTLRRQIAAVVLVHHRLEQ